MAEDNQLLPTPTSVSPFEEKLFEGTSFSDILKKSFESIDKVEQETYNLFEETRKEAKNNIKPEAKLIYNEQAKGFLELISQQNESRAKVIQAATNIVKAGQPQNQNNILNVPSSIDNISSNIKEMAKKNDPLKNITEVKTVTESTDIENKINNRLEEEEDVEIIYSPKAKEQMAKNKI